MLHTLYGCTFQRSTALPEILVHVPQLTKRVFSLLITSPDCDGIGGEAEPGEGVSLTVQSGVLADRVRKEIVAIFRQRSRQLGKSAHVEGI